MSLFFGGYAPPPRKSTADKRLGMRDGRSGRVGTCHVPAWTLCPEARCGFTQSQPFQCAYNGHPQL